LKFFPVGFILPAAVWIQRDVRRTHSHGDGAAKADSILTHCIQPVSSRMGFLRLPGTAVLAA
jgi:hypothetical protein